MTRRRSRGLLPEEEQLWRRVADTAEPLHPVRKPFAPISGAPPAALGPDRFSPGGVQKRNAALPAEPVREPFAPFRLGERAGVRGARHDLAPTVTERLADGPLRMDSRSFDRMSRGKLLPEGRIDLHGMTLAEAHPVLTRFVMGAQAQGKRLVLVITGKGRRGADDSPVPQRMGVLKQQVPHWLALPPLAGIVLQIAEAHLKHGGTGAYYVYLRRVR